MATPSILKKTAQGSVTVRVLRTGDNLFISLRSNKGLAQGINERSGIPVPDWDVAANQPTVTPEVTSAMGGAVSLTAHRWEYNGVSLTFDSSGTCISPGLSGKFKLDTSSGALTITGNLASKSNVANDTLTYRGVASVDGVDYDISKTTDIVIQPMGDGGYLGVLTASITQLSDIAGSDTSTLYTRLFSESGEVSSYWVKYFKDDTEWKKNTSGQFPVVTRSDVNGEQLFIAVFYSDKDYTNELCQAAIRITDTTDIYHLNTAIVSSNTQVAAGKDVKVKSEIINIRTGKTLTPASPVWSTRIIRKKDWQEVRRVASDTITVSLADCTDSDGITNDVEIHAEVEWSESLTQATGQQWTQDAIAHPVDISGSVLQMAGVKI